jgi:tetratricopeptide (TPR) repeat protein
VVVSAPSAADVARPPQPISNERAEAAALFAAAVKDHHAGRESDAIALYRRILSFAPDLPEVHCNLGVALAGLGRLDEAEASLRKAISLRADSAEIHINLGTVLLNLGRPHEAIVAYRAAIALKPESAEAHSDLGMALMSVGMPDEAEVALRWAIALNPNLVEGHYNLANGLMTQGRVDEAVVCYRTTIALRPSLADAYNSLGIALKELGRVMDAREVTEQAIRLNPSQAKYFRSLGEVKRFVAGDPYLVAMEELARNAETLPEPDQIELNFALAKAYEDLDEHALSFDRLLAGNALKRRQIVYAEETILDGLKRVEGVFSRELIERRQSVGEPSALPVFVVGMARSGSSLVEQIIASHPQAFGAGELKQFGKAAENIGSSEPQAAEFPEAVIHMSDEELRRFGANYLGEIGRLAPRAKRIVNKMPANYILAGLIHLTLPNATIIHTIRDPADTCVSCFSKLFTEDQNHTYDLTELGRYHRHYRALMAHWHGVLPPGRILDVRYEDIVADLEGMARRIIAHCGLNWSPCCLEFHRTERPVRTASAVQVRQPLYSTAVGRWRAYEPFIGPLLAELNP